MKITLINAAARNDPLRGSHPFMPLALPLLAATAPSHDYHLVDLLADRDVDFAQNADLVGISMRASAERRAFEIADAFRRRGISVVIGGPQASARPLDAIRHADTVAIGEAERLWPVIVGDAKSNRLRDFYVCSTVPFRPRGYSVYQIDAFPPLDKIPCAARGLFGRRYVFDTVFASRGCPVDCDFCAVTRLFGKTTRLRPLKHVLAEIDGLGRYFYLLDDTVFGREDTYAYYRSLYEAVARLGTKRFWTGQANLDAAAHGKGREVIRAAANSGMIYAAIGIESINARTLELSGAVRKMGARSGEEAVEKMRVHLQFIQQQGIVVSGWFVLGYPDDTIGTYADTFEFCRQTNIIPVVFPVHALAGTRLYERAAAEGMIDDSRALNLLHSGMREQDVFRALRRIRRKGFSATAILKRTAFYARHFTRDRIRNSIFSLVLQTKLRRGLDARQESD